MQWRESKTDKIPTILLETKLNMDETSKNAGTEKLDKIETLKWPK